MHFIQNCGCVGSSSWLPNQAGCADTADEWVRSPSAVSWVPCNSGDEKVGTLSTPRTISSVGFEWPSPHVASVFPAI
jgi:hypothetical protein